MRNGIICQYPADLKKYPHAALSIYDWIGFSIQGYRSGERYTFAIILQESNELAFM